MSSKYSVALHDFQTYTFSHKDPDGLDDNLKECLKWKWVRMFDLEGVCKSYYFAPGLGNTWDSRKILSTFIRMNRRSKFWYIDSQDIAKGPQTLDSHTINIHGTPDWSIRVLVPYLWAHHVYGLIKEGVTDIRELEGEPLAFFSDPSRIEKVKDILKRVKRK